MDSPVSSPSFRLTALAHGGGCGCKLAPSVLQQLLQDQPVAGPFARLLVGTETGDDAAVWQLDGETCVIATTDFFMPVVDDPFDFGRIAATNAISDVYAMGGRPIMALAILGMPIDKMPAETVRDILKGGSTICAEAGIPVAGGHSIDSPEPIYGLAVIATCPTASLRRNSAARDGDALILTKALGVGIYSAAFRKGMLPADAYAEFIASTTLLNSIGAELALDADVHAMTDVTGFGILGHALEMARGSNVRIWLRADDMAVFSQAAELAQKDFVTGASHRNWASYSADIALPDGLPAWRRHILTDPQTSGGLLVSCDGGRAEELLGRIIAAGYPAARIIGTVEEGEPGVRVTP
ncbi:selenide, water dikinase SelD [Phyllobacterium phragmitis]|uniref:Selenide, water dikinase n=1 Tax=Phyllobacterium phragmitis TaxID=2670329 RepID=A0A2S9IYP0_9HYPH|nr:selenide, water dikinase SelD [Phyllobacterium phragmitis]PRD45646.1 selenide, water dikinase SelD [Phyllobacterium phragmitis]